MTRQIHSELVKALTGRAWWIIGLVLVVLSVGLTGLLTLAVHAAPKAQLDLDTADGVGVLYNLPASIGFVLPLIFGIVLVTGEYQSRTIAQTLLAEPRRLRVFGAKLAAAFVLTTALAVVTMAATALVVLLVLRVLGLDPMITSGPVLTRILGGTAALVLWGLVGIGIGALVRNQLVAVVVVLAFTQFLEPIIRVLSGSFGLTGVLDVLPGSASDIASGGTLLTMATGTGGSSQLLGLLVLAGYTGVAALLGAARFRQTAPA